MTTHTAGTSPGAEPIDRTASRVAQQAGQTVEKQASVTMDKAAQTVDQVATAVRQAGDGLREQQPQIASFADTAAQQVEQVGRYLREHEPQEVISGIESWARRQPALAVGGALAIGLLVGRFIRSASPPRQRSSWAGASSGYGYGSDLAREGADRGGYGRGMGYGAGTGYAGSAGFAAGTGYAGGTADLGGSGSTGYAGSTSASAVRDADYGIGTAMGPGPTSGSGYRGQGGGAYDASDTSVFDEGSIDDVLVGEPERTGSAARRER